MMTDRAVDRPTVLSPEDWEYVEGLARSDFARRGIRGDWGDELQDTRLAALDAARTFDPRRGPSLRAWVTKKIRWAVDSALRRRTDYNRATRTSREPTFVDPDALVALAGDASSDDSLEREEYAAREVARLREIAGDRERTILGVVMHGGSMRDAGLVLGIGKSRADQLFQAFRRKARRDRARRDRAWLDRESVTCLGPLTGRCPMEFECVRDWQRIARKEVARRIA